MDMAPIEAITFANQTLSALPLDPIKDRESRSVKGAWFSLLEPQLDPLDNPLLVSFSSDALDLLDVDTDQVSHWRQRRKKEKPGHDGLDKEAGRL